MKFTRKSPDGKWQALQRPARSYVYRNHRSARAFSLVSNFGDGFSCGLEFCSHYLLKAGRLDGIYHLSLSDHSFPGTPFKRWRSKFKAPKKGLIPQDQDLSRISSHYRILLSQPSALSNFVIFYYNHREGTFLVVQKKQGITSVSHLAPLVHPIVGHVNMPAAAAAFPLSGPDAVPTKR